MPVGVSAAFDLTYAGEDTTSSMLSCSNCKAGMNSTSREPGLQRVTHHAGPQPAVRWGSLKAWYRRLKLAVYACNCTTRTSRTSGGISGSGSTTSSLPQLHHICPWNSLHLPWTMSLLQPAGFPVSSRTTALPCRSVSIMLTAPRGLKAATGSESSSLGREALDDSLSWNDLALTSSMIM